MRPLLARKSAAAILPTHDGEHHVRLNALADENTAESKKRKRERERGQKKRSEKILEQKKGRRSGEMGGERGRCEKKKDELKHTCRHAPHFGHLPFRDVRVECFSMTKRCRVKKRGAKRGEVRGCERYESLKF